MIALESLPAARIAVDAVIFDAYGTLFDVHSVAARAEASADVPPLLA